MNNSLFHASCVSYQGRGLLIKGASGAGKSGLSLQLMALGCDLVSDDRTFVNVENGQLIATAPSSIAGKIEARGVGVLSVPYQVSAAIIAIVDMDQVENTRMPEPRYDETLGCTVPVLHKVVHSYFPAALLQYLKGTLVSER